MTVLAAILGILGLGATIGVMVWLMKQPEQPERRSIAEWEIIHRIRIVGWEGFTENGRVVDHLMTAEEFMERANESTCATVPRQVPDVRNWGHE